MRFARVPTGRETCGWCYMLASRGFRYTSAQAASAGSHEGCDCLVVPGVDGETSVEGYDPEWMRSCWSDCVSTVANDSLRRRARELWEAMGGDERAAYRARLGKEAQAFVDGLGDEELARFGLDEASRDEGGFWRFYAERAYDEARREVERRDPRWLYGGTAPSVDTSAIDVGLLNSDQMIAFKKDFAAASCMASHGVRVEMIDNPLIKAKLSVPKFDYRINGDYYEAKCPEGSGYLSVVGNITKSDDKFKKIGSKSYTVLSNISSAMTDDEFMENYEESLSDVNTDYSNVSVIVFLLKSGAMLRYTNK